MKKFLIFLVLAGGAASYAYSNITPEKIVELAYEQNDPRLTPRLVYYAARYQLYKGRNEAVLAILDPYMEAVPDNPYREHMVFRQGQACEGLREFARARELFALYLQEYPNGEHANLARAKSEILKDYR